MELIERIRKDIQARLDALLGEAEKLRKALAALDPRGSSGASTARAAAPRTPARSPSRPAGRSSTSRRTPPGATKRRVLDALADGQAKTAGEVATASGVARGTVSTTLSKLAKSGEVVKAERGYRLPSAPGASAPKPTPRPTPATAEGAG